MPPHTMEQKVGMNVANNMYASHGDLSEKATLVSEPPRV